MSGAELIEFPDPVDALIAELDPNMSVPVVGRVPSPRPKEFVLIRLVGGAQELVYDRPTLTVEGYASNGTRAYTLCAAAVAYLMRAGRDGWMGAIPCRSVDVFARPADLPDPLTEQARYTATVAVTLRGSGA